MKIRQYRLLHMPFMAFFSKRLYRDVGHNWKGINFAYLFLLLAICCVPITLQVRESMLQSLETGQVQLLNQIPELTIKNGHASIDQKQPYYLKRADGSPLAIIDTTGSMNYIAEANVLALLTENKLIIRRGKNLFNTFELEGVEDLYIDKHIASNWVQLLKSTISPLSYGLFLMLSYIFAVLALLFIAIVGLILSTAMHNPLRFPSALRIATTAATPAIIFITISAALGHTIPGFVYLGVTMLYLFVGIKSCGKIPEIGEQVDLKASLHEESLPIKEAA